MEANKLHKIVERAKVLIFVRFHKKMEANKLHKKNGAFKTNRKGNIMNELIALNQSAINGGLQQTANHGGFLLSTY